MQHPRKAVHGAQGGAKIVRHGIGEGIQLLVGGHELGGSLLHELALPPFPFIRLDEPRIELAVLEEQHHEHEARSK